MSRARTRIADQVKLFAEIAGKRLELSPDMLRALGGILTGNNQGLTAELQQLFKHGVLDLGESPAPDRQQIAALLNWDDSAGIKLDRRTDFSFSFLGNGKENSFSASTLYSCFIPLDLAAALSQLARMLRKAGVAMIGNATTRGRTIPPADWYAEFGAIYRKCFNEGVLPEYFDLSADPETGFRMAIKRPLQTSECAFGEVTIGLRRTDRTQATRTYIDLPIEALGPCAEMLRQLARGLPRLELARYIANSAHARALYDLAAALIRGKFLGPGKTNSPPDWDRMLPPDHSLSVLHIGHAALLCRGGADSVLVDPWFLPDDPAFAQQPFAASDLPPIGAIFLTHEHWDHINPGFLLHYPPDLPIIVPKQDDQSALYPHYREYLALFGLTNVIELGHWERYALPDGMIVTAIPFRGEGSAEDQAVRNCYHIERKGSSAFVHVDSSLDSIGESDIIDGTIARLKAELGPVDVLYATRRQELHFGHEVLNDLTPIFLGEDPRRIHSALENCYCPADYIADLARACGSSAVVLYSEGGCEWFPAGTNFLRSGDDDVFLGQDYLWDRLEAFIDACPVPLHYSNPLDAVFLSNGAIDFAGPVIAAG